MDRQRGRGTGDWRRSDSIANTRILHRPTGGIIQVRASTERALHGGRYWIAVLDEAAQFHPGRASESARALITGLGKLPGSRIIAISTRSMRPGSWWADLIDGGTIPDEGILVHDYTAPTDIDPYTDEAVMAANPGYPVFPDPDVIRMEQKQARRNIRNEIAYRTYRLNQGEQAEAGLVETLIPAADYEQCTTTQAPTIEGGYTLGIDLGRDRSLTSLIAVDEAGTVDHLSIVGTPPTIGDRDREAGADGALHKAHRDGELIAVRTRFPEPEHVLQIAAERWGQPNAIRTDTYRDGELAAAANMYGWGHLVTITRGSEQAAEAVAALRRACANRQLVIPNRLQLLTRSVGWAKMGNNFRGEPIIDSRSSRQYGHGLDDCAVALTQAVAEWSKVDDTFSPIYIGSAV